MTKQLYITGSISIKKFNKFSRQLSFIENNYPKDTTINVELSSEGGDTYAALAFFDRIRASHLTVNITVFGPCFSAAVLILGAGDKRFMGKSAWVMTHEDSYSLEDPMSVTELERHAKHSRALEDQWAARLASVTKSTEEVWKILHKTETYLEAEKCLELGLVDEII